MKPEKWKEVWRKYKFAVCVMLVGVLLLLLPGKSSGAAEERASQQSTVDVSVSKAEEDLCEILREVHGVGAVRVRLSLQATEEHIYVKDEGETVLVNRGSGTQDALERKIVYPIYQGAIIVCTGADDAAVQLQIIEAVRQYTGLRTDQISVLPMKQH